MPTAYGRLALAAATLGLATYTYRWRYSADEEASPGEEDHGRGYVPRPGAEFSHPYNHISPLRRTLIKIKRYIVLSCIFLPCTAVGVVTLLSGSDYLRKYWIEMLVRCFEAAGCSFQKFGQWVSMRPDMFPPDIVKAMGSLQMDVPEHPFEYTRKTMRNSMGKEIEEVFEQFKEDCIASGSIAQVYKAVVRPGYAEEIGLEAGENGSVEVAVKVRHPSVLEQTYVDVEVIFNVVKMFDYLRIMTVPFEKDSFLASLQKQVNFEWEAYALSCFSDNFSSEQDRDQVDFPRVVPELLSPEVLVEEWAQGSTIADMFAQVGDGFQELVSSADSAITEQRRGLAEKLFGVCMKMFLRDNLMHGDLHAGNVLFRDDGSVTLIDAGHTTQLEGKNRFAFGQFMQGLCSGDVDDIVSSLLIFNEHALEPDVEGLRADVEATCKKWIAEDGRGHDGRPVCCGDIMGDILFDLGARNVQLSGDVAMSLCSIAISEGLIRQLDPEFDMNLRALPFLAQYSVGAV